MKTLNDYKQHVRPTRLEDIPIIASKIKGVGKQEIEALGYEVLEGLKLSHAISRKCWTMVVEETGEPEGLAGVCHTDLKGVGNIWAVTSEEAFNYPLRLTMIARKILKEVQKDYMILSNVVHEHNDLHMKWIQALGFIFINKTIINNNNFYEFVRI